MKKGASIYTPEELATLSRLYQTMSLREIATTMGKTFSSMQWQRHRLGLKKPLASYKTAHHLNLQLAELAYIAGLIDGEGTISIRKLRAGKWKPCIRIAGTSTVLMDWLSRTLTGPSIYTEHRKHRVNRLAYMFHVEGLSHLPLYQALEPYLVLKRNLMRLVIEFCQIRLGQSHNEPWTPRQEEIVNTIRAVNMSRYSESNDAP